MKTFTINYECIFCLEGWVLEYKNLQNYPPCRNDSVSDFIYNKRQYYIEIEDFPAVVALDLNRDFIIDKIEEALGYES